MEAGPFLFGQGCLLLEVKRTFSGTRLPANTRGLITYPPSWLADRKIQWGRAGFTQVARTQGTVFTAPPVEQQDACFVVTDSAGQKLP
jgi:hypothetical protein